MPNLTRTAVPSAYPRGAKADLLSADPAARLEHYLERRTLEAMVLEHFWTGD